jgi:hypothetical protein
MILWWSSPKNPNVTGNASFFNGIETTQNNPHGLSKLI